MRRPEFVGFGGPGLGKFLNFGTAVASPEYEGVGLSDLRSFLAG